MRVLRVSATQIATEGLILVVATIATDSLDFDALCCDFQARTAYSNYRYGNNTSSIQHSDWSATL